MTNPPSVAVLKKPSWWKNRSKLEKHLSIITIFVTLLLLICILTLIQKNISKPETLPAISPDNNGYIRQGGFGRIFGNKEYTSQNSSKTICDTPGCVIAAASLLKNMDTSVDPCDDFYEFACGKFLKEETIPEDKSSITTFSVISDLLLEQLKVIITEPIKENEAKPFRQAKEMYNACMNKDKIEELNLEPVNRIVKQLGGWPVRDKYWDEGSFTWKDMVYKFREVGYSVDYLIDFSITTDLKNSTKRVIDLDQASLGLSREYLVKGLDEKIVSAYFKYMIDVAVLFGADKDAAQRELKDALDFEMQLANISLPLEERRNASKLYNPMKVREIQRKFPSIPWLEYINTILPEGMSINDEEIIIVNTPQYITSLEALLSNTPKRIQANYMLWRAVASSVGYLGENARKIQLDYTTKISGRTEREPRWKECIESASGSFSLAVGNLYVRRYFKEKAKDNALEMVSGIREEMYKILGSVSWMDEDTRKNALDKALSMVNHIAYPEELLHTEKLVDFYKNLEINSNSYYDSILNLTKFGTDYSFRRLRQPVNKTEWISHSRPAVVNAFYNSLENSIQFPAGILQGHFFSDDRPRYLNYGAIGFVIGHEITHGFDDQGRQFDKNGNLVEWWKPDTKERYLEKAKCIIDQYGNYYEPDVQLKLNGVNTQGENIADNGGIKEAYYAYHSSIKKHGEESTLPGLSQYNPSQLFWISAANVWCSKYRPEALKLRITTGYHSPGRFRVIGPLSNQDEFAKDFKCPQGSKMNPKKKCQVW